MTKNNKEDKNNEVLLDNLPRSETNPNAKWYGKPGVSPINYVQTSKNSLEYGIFKGPPQEIPLELFAEYTMNGKIPIRWWYCNEEVSHPEDTKYSDLFVDLQSDDPFKIDNEKLIIFKKDDVNELVEQVKDKSIKYYGDIAECLHSAFKDFPIKGQNIAIMGSTHPICEAYAIHHEAIPNTIEYTSIQCYDKRINTFTVDEYYKTPDKERVRFDAALSISSFEHDGLGKYGDPLDPNGDIKAMQRMKHTIKKGGILYLAVPCGKDRIDWNAHRVYGKLRLPILLSGWELLGHYGYSNELTEITPFHELEERRAYGYRHALFILKNT